MVRRIASWKPVISAVMVEFSIEVGFGPERPRDGGSYGQVDLNAHHTVGNPSSAVLAGLAR